MNSDKMIKESFSIIGREFGYENVDAEFAPFKELKIKWQRSKGKAEFKVSDYLADADRQIMDDIARALFSRISGNKMNGYPESMNAWVTSDEFISANRPMYLRRSKNLSRTAEGDVRNLEDSRRRLIVAGLIPDYPDVLISWTRGPNVRRVGYCSVLMKVIAISSVFDNEAIPEFVMDYVVYHEFLHIMAGFNPFGRKHGPEFKAEERKYPRRDEAEQWLKKLRFYL